MAKPKDTDSKSGPVHQKTSGGRKKPAAQADVDSPEATPNFGAVPKGIYPDRRICKRFNLDVVAKFAWLMSCTDDHWCFEGDPEYFAHSLWLNADEVNDVFVMLRDHGLIRFYQAKGRGGIVQTVGKVIDGETYPGSPYTKTSASKRRKSEFPSEDGTVQEYRGHRKRAAPPSEQPAHAARTSRVHDSDTTPPHDSEQRTERVQKKSGSKAMRREMKRMAAELAALRASEASRTNRAQNADTVRTNRAQNADSLSKEMERRRESPTPSVVGDGSTQAASSRGAADPPPSAPGGATGSGSAKGIPSTTPEAPAAPTETRAEILARYKQIKARLAAQPDGQLSTTGNVVHLRPPTADDVERHRLVVAKWDAQAPFPTPEHRAEAKRFAEAIGVHGRESDRQESPLSATLVCADLAERHPVAFFGRLQAVLEQGAAWPGWQDPDGCLRAFEREFIGLEPTKATP